MKILNLKGLYWWKVRQMNNEMCFEIENKKLFLDHVLVEYSNVPIFFVCIDKDNNTYYICLCTDFDNYEYIVTEIEKKNLYLLLHGEIPMRNAMLLSTEFWTVISGEELSLDVVQKYSIEDIDMMVLPEENACFEILTKDLEQYVDNFDIVYQAHKNKEFKITNNNFINLMNAEKVNKFSGFNFVYDTEIIYKNDTFYSKEERSIITEKMFKANVGTKVLSHDGTLAA